MTARAARLLLAALGGWVATGDAAAQGIIRIGLPTADSLPAAPVITATASNVPEEFCPCETNLEISTTATFAVLLAVGSRPGLDVSFTLARPLPERTRIHLRGYVNDRFGTRRAEQVTQAVTRSWLRLVRPVGLNRPEFTRQPTFVWSASPVTSPPGPWTYDVSIVNTATQRVAASANGLTDTTFTPSNLLEANTSYRWSVRARLATGETADQVTVVSPTTFVISSADAPLATLLFRTFPNPFPSPISNSACIWFDLAVRSRVQLTVHDIQGHPVRRLFNAELDAGAYGRALADAGCSGAYQWDGTDDRGRTVQPGVYNLVFRSAVDGVTNNVLIRFRGR